MIHIRDPWDLKRKILKYHLEKNKPAEKIYTGSANLSPSLILSTEQGPRCDLFLGYKLVGMPGTPKIEPAMRRRMDAGSAIHKLYQNYIVDIYGGNRVSVESEARIPDLYLRMFADGILDKRFGLEIKTASARVFDAVVRSGKPTRQHLDQGLFLFKGFGWEACTYLYINMDALNDLETQIMLPADYVSEEYIQGELEKADVEPIVATFEEARWTYFEDRIRNRVTAPIDELGEAPEKSEGSWCYRCPYAQPCKEDVW
jgi:hypothetical protein